MVVTVVVDENGIVDFIRNDGTVCHPHGSVRLYEPTAAELEGAVNNLANAIDAEILNRYLRDAP